MHRYWVRGESPKEDKILKSDKNTIPTVAIDMSTIIRMCSDRQSNYKSN